jgi:hypothetical protein
MLMPRSQNLSAQDHREHTPELPQVTLVESPKLATKKSSLDGRDDWFEDRCLQKTCITPSRDGSFTREARIPSLTCDSEENEIRALFVIFR